MKTKYWQIAFWILLVSWVIGAVLYMAKYNGGFLTNYLSDLAFPPWFYIYIRGLWRNDNRIPHLLLFGDWFGLSPIRTFASIFIVGVVTEIKTLYWPTGFISGTFDPIDILCYAVGLLFCYFFDKREKL